MLSVQVEYLKLKETERHNLASEAWNNASLSEQTRHNIATEQYNYDVLSENRRHNIATEDYYTAQLEESKRHNQAQESIGWFTAQTSRLEVPIKETQAQASMDSASANMQNASTNFYNATTNEYNAKSKRAETKANIFTTVTQGMSNLWKMGTSLGGVVSGVFKK